MMRCSRIRGRDRERDEMERNDDNDDEVSNNDWVKTMQTIQPVGVTTRAKTSVIVMTCCVDSLILKISLVSTFIPIFNPHSSVITHLASTRRTTQYQIGDIAIGGYGT